MLHVKKVLSGEKYYLSLMLSMMMNTVCARIVDQTDLVMMKRISEDAAASLLSLRSVSFVDFIIALTVVPILGVMLQKSNNQEEKELLTGVFAKKFVFCAILTTLFSSILYPTLLFLSVKDESVRSLTLVLVVPLVLNIPGKMMQFFFSTSLCVHKRTKPVTIFWSLTVVLNIVMNFLFMRFFGSVGCLISTVFVTLFVCTGFFIILSRDFNLSKNFFKKFETKIPVGPMISEGFRIVVEKMSGYIFFIICMNFSTKSDFTQIGIMNGLMTLLLVPFIAGMRATALATSKEGRGLLSKMLINIAIGILVIALFMTFFRPIVRGLYKIEETDSRLWIFFKATIPIVIISNSVSSVLRGECQFKLKQALLFKIDAVIKWGIHIPLCFAIFFRGSPFLFPLILAVQSVVECGTLFLQKRLG